MTASNDAVGDDTDVQTAIREATYRALCRHGYHETTIQHIADEFEKSKSLLYYHYEDKDELLADFLGHLLDHLAEILDVDEGDPEADLRALIDRLVPSPMCDEDRRFRRVVLALPARAPPPPTYRGAVARPAPPPPGARAAGSPPRGGARGRAAGRPPPAGPHLRAARRVIRVPVMTASGISVSYSGPSAIYLPVGARTVLDRHHGRRQHHIYRRVYATTTKCSARRWRTT